MHFAWLRMQDVYSWAMIMWEMLCGQLPWYGMTNVQILFAVTVNQQRPDLPGAWAAF
jgi:hypothetical protein